MILRPEILTQPCLPKPIHGLNPRSIRGRIWWDEVRQEVYEKNDYHCWACGIHKSEGKLRQWLEAHECYEIDYIKGRAEMKEVVALCHSCHNFIHSQRLLAIYLKRELKPWDARYIIERGLNIVYENGLEPFYTAKIAYLVIVEGLSEKEASKIIPVPEFLKPENTAKWENWRLVMDGIEYEPIYKNTEEWAVAYNVCLEEESES